jgi:hypothetical protein
MFSGASVAYWLFGMCFARSLGVSLVSLERMRKQVNLVVPAESAVSWRRPLPRSLKQFMWDGTIVGFSLEVLDQHRRHYPASSLPSVLGGALIGTILSFVALALAQ